MVEVRKQVTDIVISPDTEDIADLAIVVHFVVESTKVDENGDAISGERKRERKHKRVRLAKKLKASTVVSKLARDVMKLCPFIHVSKKDELEKVLQELQHLLIREDIRATTAEEGGDWWKHDDETGEEDDDGGPADLSKLEDYIELLYEGSKDNMGPKIRGTAKILELCHHVDNLELLIQDTTLMGAVTRVLGDEYKSSVALCYNIMRMFLAFCNFGVMHPILAQYRVGSVTMKIVELEVKRAQHREEERKKRRLQSERDKSSSTQTSSELQAMRRKLERDELKWSIQSKQQDKLLFVCFHVLINLAEDVQTEKKMVKKGLVEHLGALLDRTSVNLLYLVVTFLKKLSIFEENKERMCEADIAKHLVKLVGCSCEPLTVMSLRLLYNVSFDRAIRQQLVKGGLIPKLVDLLKDNERPTYRGRCLRLLYHMSIDDRTKSLFAYAQALPVVVQLVLNFPKEMLAKELGALAVNLSHCPRNAELMSEKRGLQHLVARLEEHRDPLLAKVIRNIALWTYSVQSELARPEREYKFRQLWPLCLEQLLDVMTDTESHDVMIEVMGTLSCLTELDFPKDVTWEEVVKKYNLIPFLCKLLVPGMAQNDVLLEVVILVGQFATDAKVARLLGTSNIVSALHELMLDAATDDVEMKLQLLYTLWRLLKHPETREEVMCSDSSFNEALAALSCNHPPTREMADLYLDLVLELERNEDGSLGELGRKIRKRRFEAYNREWLALDTRENGEGGGGNNMSYNLHHGGGAYSDGLSEEEPDELAAGRRHSEALAMEMMGGGGGHPHHDMMGIGRMGGGRGQHDEHSDVSDNDSPRGGGGAGGKSPVQQRDEYGNYSRMHSGGVEGEGKSRDEDAWSNNGWR